MDALSSTDRLVLLLRERLAARAKTLGRSRTESALNRSDGPHVRSVEELAKADGVDDRQVRRALIGNILTEHFGDAVLNDPRFQQVVGRVTDTLLEDARGAALMIDVIADFARRR